MIFVTDYDFVNRNPLLHFAVAKLLHHQLSVYITLRFLRTESVQSSPEQIYLYISLPHTFAFTLHIAIWTIFRCLRLSVFTTYLFLICTYTCTTADITALCPCCLTSYQKPARILCQKRSWFQSKMPHNLLDFQIMKDMKRVQISVASTVCVNVYLILTACLGRRPRQASERTAC